MAHSWKDWATRLARRLGTALSGLLVVGAWVLGLFVILMLIGWGLPYLDTPIERVRALASRDAPPSREPTLGRIYVESPEV